MKKWMIAANGLLGLSVSLLLVPACFAQISSQAPATTDATTATATSTSTSTSATSEQSAPSTTNGNADGAQTYNVPQPKNLQQTNMTTQQQMNAEPQQPATSTANPATIIETPATSTANPATTIETPATSTANPAATTAAPATSTANPATTTAAPATSAANPATTTAAPVTNPAASTNTANTAKPEQLQTPFSNDTTTQTTSENNQAQQSAATSTASQPTSAATTTQQSAPAAATASTGDQAKPKAEQLSTTAKVNQEMFATSTQDLQQITDVAKAAVTAVYNYNSTDYKAKLAVAKQYFTTVGYDSFSKALEKSGNLQVLMNKKLTIKTQQIGTAKVVLKKMMQGKPVWVVKIPFTVNYIEQGGQSVSQNLDATAVIARKTNSNAFGVNQLIVKPLPAPQQGQ